MQGLTKRLSIWAIVVAIVLIIPLVLTLLGSGVDGDGWHWTFFDFVFMGTILFGACVVYELVAGKMNNGLYRKAVGLSVVTAVLLVWINAAVGIIGQGPLNLMYFGVLVIGLICAIIFRFKPIGMSRALFVTALGQFLVPIIAFIIWDYQITSERSILGVFALNSFFSVLFVVSALLFRRVAHKSK